MPFNVPSVDTSNISFGPARLFLGAVGDTPTVDVGAISEDGVTIELQNEARGITQGNPRTLEFKFAQQQGVMVRVTSIEWDFDNLLYAMGAGNTTSTGSEDTFAFGGDACLTEVALHVQHQMCQSGHTLDTYVWKAVAEGGVNLPFGQDEHSFEYAWEGLRSATNWAGAALASDEQLIKIVRTTV